LVPYLEEGFRILGKVEKFEKLDCLLESLLAVEGKYGVLRQVALLVQRKEILDDLSILQQIQLLEFNAKYVF
jgi:hypothetical protein